MAVTKIWDVKGRLDHPLEYIQNPDKTFNTDFDEKDMEALADVIEYAANEDKTEKRYYVSSVNCNITCARKQFMTIKRAFGKEGGIIAYHAYQSFAPGETTPEQAHEIGVELAKRLWGDRFQVVVATHLNTNCLHNHFVINSVSFKDGKRFHDCRETYKNLKDASDQLCREYGLSVVEKPHRKEREEIWIAHASKEGMPTRYNLARDAIDEAISKSCNMHEFEMYLKALGYATQFNPRRKYWTVVPKGWSQPIRLARLGSEYTNQRIYERILENDRSVRMHTFQKAAPKQYLLLTRYDKIKKKTGLKGLYLRYCYALGYLPKYNQKPNKVHYLLKEDLLMCEKISEEARLLGENNIETRDDLENYKNGLMKQVEHLREEIRTRKETLDKSDETNERQFERGQIAYYSDLLAQTKKKIRLCDDILARSEKVSEKMDKVERDEEKEVKR